MGYEGKLSRTLRVRTKAGRVCLAAREDLIVRRPVYAHGEDGTTDQRALDTATLLCDQLQGPLDEDSLRREVGIERVTGRSMSSSGGMGF